LCAEKGSVVPGATFFFCVVDFCWGRGGRDGVGGDCECDLGGGCAGTERGGVRWGWRASLVVEEKPWDGGLWGRGVLRDYGLN
jgi:hypothetical protein